MTDADHQILEPLRGGGDDSTGSLARLHAHLVERSTIEGLLDVAYRTIDTAFGPLLLAATEAGLLRVAYAAQDHQSVLADLAARVSPRVLRAPRRLDLVAHQIEEYLAGRRRRFDLALDLQLSTGFYRSVLDHLPTIAYGATTTYATMAALAGNPKAVRAAGSACATNPLPIVVPCHRVIRSDGTIGAYVGGGQVKQSLLGLEMQGMRASE